MEGYQQGDLCWYENGVKTGGVRLVFYQQNATGSPAAYFCKTGHIQENRGKLKIGKPGIPGNGKRGRYLVLCLPMARVARVVGVDVAHHVTQGGNGREFILATDAERMVYLDLLRQTDRGRNSAIATDLPISESS